MSHQWSGWPGAYCMKCGQSDPTEEALFCKEGCDLKCYPGDTATDKMCAKHQAWADALATCPPTKAAIDKLKAEHPSLFAARDEGKL